MVRKHDNAYTLKTASQDKISRPKKKSPYFEKSEIILNQSQKLRI
jgi:hypothetical protein